MLEKDVELLGDTKGNEGYVEELELLEATTDVEGFEELLEGGRLCNLEELDDDDKRLELVETLEELVEDDE
jgi:hypothetical protein